jgi:ligand-binding SRPBCC domain-containing protein
VIDYHIRLHGLRLRWRTRISEWNPPFEFVDVQARGPYAEWVHRHRFTATPEGGTLVEDEVQFRLPLGLLGTIAAPLVKRQLRRIFTHRYHAISGAIPSRSPALGVRVMR